MYIYSIPSKGVAFTSLSSLIRYIGEHKKGAIRYKVYKLKKSTFKIEGDTIQKLQKK